MVKVPAKSKKDNRTRVRVSIDPGNQGTGVAFWADREWDQCVAPLACYNFLPRGQAAHWSHRTFGINSRLRDELRKWNIVAAYFEQPEFFDNASGHMVAKSGDLIKLCFFFGACCQMFHDLGVSEQVYYPVHEWKGQLPKEVVTQRIIATIPDVTALKPKSHSWDAIGIGLFAKGFMNQ